MNYIDYLLKIGLGIAFSILGGLLLYSLGRLSIEDCYNRKQKINYCIKHDFYYDNKKCPKGENVKIRNWSYIAKYNLMSRIWYIS